MKNDDEPFLTIGNMDLKITKEGKIQVRAVFQRMGMKKGNISKALEEAIEVWIKTYQK